MNNLNELSKAQVPTREEAIAIAVETLEAFAPHLLAARVIPARAKSILGRSAKEP